MLKSQREVNMFRRFFAQQYNFFDLFDRHAQTALEGVKLIVEAMEKWPAPDILPRISEVEHQCDVIAHMAIDLMRRTYITPFDRDEIRELVSCLDDVIDYTNGAAIRMRLFQIDHIPPEMMKLAKVLVKCQEAVVDAVKLLRTIKKSKSIPNLCQDIHRLENEADNLNHEGVAALFQKEKDAVAILKLKEIYEMLEEATDRCEDVAQAVEGIIIEHLG